MLLSHSTTLLQVSVAASERRNRPSGAPTTGWGPHYSSRGVASRPIPAISLSPRATGLARERRRPDHICRGAFLSLLGVATSSYIR